MKKELFGELMESVGEALQHARGKRELRTTVLPDAPAAMSAADIRGLRKELNASQAVFARFLNVSTQLVQAWEANRRRPDGAASRLLEKGRRAPDLVFPGLVTVPRSKPATTTGRRHSAVHAKSSHVAPKGLPRQAKTVSASKA